MTQLSQELDIDLVSVSPIFDLAAKKGKLLYYPLDTHWNSDAKELAAAFVADTLKSRYLSPHPASKVIRRDFSAEAKIS